MCGILFKGHKVRRKTSSPLGLGTQNNRNDLRLKRKEPGNYKLRWYFKTKLGQYKEKFSTIYVDNH